MLPKLGLATGLERRFDTLRDASGLHPVCATLILCVSEKLLRRSQQLLLAEPSSTTEPVNCGEFYNFEPRYCS